MYVLQLLWLLICSVGWTPEDGSKEKLAQVPVQSWTYISTPAILYNFIWMSPSPPSFYINFLMIHVVSSSSLSIHIYTYHLHYPFSILLTFWRQRQKCSRTIFHLQLRYDIELVFCTDGYAELTWMPVCSVVQLCNWDISVKLTFLCCFLVTQLNIQLWKWSAIVWAKVTFSVHVYWSPDPHAVSHRVHRQYRHQPSVFSNTLCPFVYLHVGGWLHPYPSPVAHFLLPELGSPATVPHKGGYRGLCIYIYIYIHSTSTGTSTQPV